MRRFVGAQTGVVAEEVTRELGRGGIEPDVTRAESKPRRHAMPDSETSE